MFIYNMSCYNIRFTGTSKGPLLSSRIKDDTLMRFK